MKRRLKDNPQELRSAYYAGEITVTDLLREVEKSKEGDRTRRAAEKKYKKISEACETLQC